MLKTTVLLALLTGLLIAVGGFFGGTGGMVAATLIQLGISRTREYQADETGGLMTGNPRSLASALQKIEYYAQNEQLSAATPATSHLFIVNPFSGSGSWIVSLFSTHPATEQRVARLNMGRCREIKWKK